MEENKKRTAWNLVLVGSVIGIVGALTDLIYHVSIGETEDVFGRVPLENITHPLPFLIYFVIIAIYLWQRYKK